MKSYIFPVYSAPKIFTEHIFVSRFMHLFFVWFVTLMQYISIDRQCNLVEHFSGLYGIHVLLLLVCRLFLHFLRTSVHFVQFSRISAVFSHFGIFRISAIFHVFSAFYCGVQNILRWRARTLILPFVPRYRFMLEWAHNFIAI